MSDTVIRVHILHVVNPHLIIVEPNFKRGIRVIHRIGIYGVLPVFQTIDIDGETELIRCENWPVATNIDLKEILKNNNNIAYFHPVPIEGRRNIFNEDEHQFGELYLDIMSERTITIDLMKMGVVVKDVPTFLDKLSRGAIKVKQNIPCNFETLRAVEEAKNRHRWNQKVKPMKIVYDEVVQPQEPARSLSRGNKLSNITTSRTEAQPETPTVSDGIVLVNPASSTEEASAIEAAFTELNENSASRTEEQPTSLVDQNQVACTEAQPEIATVRDDEQPFNCGPSTDEASENEAFFAESNENSASRTEEQPTSLIDQNQITCTEAQPEKPTVRDNELPVNSGPSTDEASENEAFFAESNENSASRTEEQPTSLIDQNQITCIEAQPEKPTVRDNELPVNSGPSTDEASENEAFFAESNENSASRTEEQPTSLIDQNQITCTEAQPEKPTVRDNELPVNSGPSTDEASENEAFFTESNENSASRTEEQPTSLVDQNQVACTEAQPEIATVRDDEQPVNSGPSTDEASENEAFFTESNENSASRTEEQPTSLVDQNQVACTEAKPEIATVWDDEQPVNSGPSTDEASENEAFFTESNENSASWPEEQPTLLVDPNDHFQRGISYVINNIANINNAEIENAGYCFELNESPILFVITPETPSQNENIVKDQNRDKGHTDDDDNNDNHGDDDDQCIGNDDDNESEDHHDDDYNNISETDNCHDNDDNNDNSEDRHDDDEHNDNGEHNDRHDDDDHDDNADNNDSHDGGDSEDNGDNEDRHDDDGDDENDGNDNEHHDDDDLTDEDDNGDTDPTNDNNDNSQTDEDEEENAVISQQLLHREDPRPNKDLGKKPTTPETEHDSDDGNSTSENGGCDNESSNNDLAALLQRAAETIQVQLMEINHSREQIPNEEAQTSGQHSIVGEQLDVETSGGRPPMTEKDVKQQMNRICKEQTDCAESRESESDESERELTQRRLEDNSTDDAEISVNVDLLTVTGTGSRNNGRNSVSTHEHNLDNDGLAVEASNEPTADIIEPLQNTDNLLNITVPASDLQIMENLSSNVEGNSIQDSQHDDVQDLLTSDSSTDHSEDELDEASAIPENINKMSNDVNFFQNVQISDTFSIKSRPKLMLHVSNRIFKQTDVLPLSKLQNIPFKRSIRWVLKTMGIENPKPLQTVTWPYILSGYNMFVISPAKCGKTIGYVPAVCNLVSNHSKNCNNNGPICIIICATAKSVYEITNLCEIFFGARKHIVSFYTGLDLTETKIALLKGCRLLICTAPAFITLSISGDFRVDLQRLVTIVFDDCDRLSQVYTSELDTIFEYMKTTLGSKFPGIQHVLVSKEWTDLMKPCAKVGPKVIIAIEAFEECVLYSNATVLVNFATNNDDKVNMVLNFLVGIDKSKRIVIICRDDEEVVFLESALSAAHNILSTKSTLEFTELVFLKESWATNENITLRPILICSDADLDNLNVSNANYLINFSIPSLYTTFCKRFYLLNENYSSIFETEQRDVKIKIFLDYKNVEQLPAILRFVKRCTKKTFPNLEDVHKKYLEAHDLKETQMLSPICDNLLLFGECVDYCCSSRHRISEKTDTPKDWMPKQDVITFQILHYDSAATYSARVLSKTSNSECLTFSNNYNVIKFKMARYYSKSINRKPHGVPKIGDVCTITFKDTVFKRGRVMKLTPSVKECVVVKLIDEEIKTSVSLKQLYHLPDDLKEIESYVVKVRLANIQPIDKDVAFSPSAVTSLQEMTDSCRQIYMRGQVVMTLGNVIFINTAEACLDHPCTGEVTVKLDFFKSLLNNHAVTNPNHIKRLKKISGAIGVNDGSPTLKKNIEWAQLDDKYFSIVHLMDLADTKTIFFRLAKNKKDLDLLLKDINEYAQYTPDIDQSQLYVGNIVLAKFIKHNIYHRARIDTIISEQIVNCFYVDRGYTSHVAVNKIKPAINEFIYRMPFQAIECRLLGVKPVDGSNRWPLFCRYWLHSHCLTDSQNNSKELLVRQYTVETATATGGSLYGILLFDFGNDEQIFINRLMAELNVAKILPHEEKYLTDPPEEVFLPRPTGEDSGLTDER